MKVFKHTNQSKKLILVIVCIMLFSFCCPTKVHAFELEDIVMAPCHLFYWIPKGLLRFFNNIFCDDAHQNEEVVYLSPETIIKGKFLLLNPNIFNTGSGGTYFDQGNMKEGTSISQGRAQLRETIAGWYYALRNLAIIALLSVLVYIGIRMLLTSISQDKAKYKMMLKDWLVALILLFAMHYIMIGILEMSDKVTKAIGATGTSVNMTAETMQKVEDILFDDKGDWSDKKYREDNEYDIGDAYAQTLVFFVIIIYTGIFLFKYLMRTIRVIFLILLAPISCITYPIDKISDGKAQAYNRWFQEFFYEIIIQPFHLLIYIVLVGSASTLANTNVIYALMCFAIMIPAEKFIKEMFGFKDKLGSPLSAFASGAVASQLGNIAKSLINKKGSTNSGNNDKDSGSDNRNNQIQDRQINDRDLVDNDNTQLNPRENDDNQQETGDNDNAQLNLRESDDNQQETGDNDNAQLNPRENDGNQQETGDSDNAQLNSKENSDKENKKEKKKNLKNKTRGTIQKGFTNAGKNIRQMNNTFQRRAAKKYGTTNRFKRSLKRGGKLLKTLAKTGAVAGVTGVGAAYLVATGQVGKATSLVAGVTGIAALRTGQRAITGARGTINDYKRDMRSDKGKEKLAKKDFFKNTSQWDKADFSYRKNHNGTPPNRKQLQQEMEDRFTLSRYGLSDDQIDKALPIYQERRDQLLNNGRNKETAERIAATQAKRTSDLKDEVKASDLKDPKKVQNLYNNMIEEFTDPNGLNCDLETADKYARRYLQDVGRMHGIKKVALPPRVNNQTIDIPLTRRTADLANSLGIAGPEYTEEQASEVHNLNVRLHDQGYSDTEISTLAQSVANSRMKPEGVIKNFENLVNTSVEYVEDGNARSAAEQLIKDTQHVQTASKSDIDAEMRERFIFKQTMGVKNEKDVTVARSLETTMFEVTDKQIAREYSKKNKTKIKNGDDMTVQKQELEKTLRDQYNLTKETAHERAEQIHDFATGIYNAPGKTKNKK